MHQRPLQTVRQFYFVDIQLSDHIDEKALKTLSNTKLEQKLDKILSDTVENSFIAFRKFFLFSLYKQITELLTRAQNEHTGHPKQPKKPYYFI